MSDDSLYVSNDGIGWLCYHTDRTDESDYRTEYVRGIVFKNVGSGWYRGIEFGGPDAIDHLIAALVFAREQQKCGGHFDDWCIGAEGYAGKERENTFNSMVRCNREFEARLKDGKWVCDACGEAVTTEYYEKPLFCSHCGSFFKKHVEVEA